MLLVSYCGYSAANIVAPSKDTDPECDVYEFLPFVKIRVKIWQKSHKSLCFLFIFDFIY